MPRSQRRRFGATSFGTPTYLQKLRDAKADGHRRDDIVAARNEAIAEGFAKRGEAAVAREEAARAADEISKADEDGAVELEPMYQALKEGGGYKPYWSSKPGSETRWPVSAMDIQLQRKADGKDKNRNWRGLSSRWCGAYSSRI